jgi:transposase
VSGKQGFDMLMMEIGQMMAETIMLMERAEISGADYRPLSPEKWKWAYRRRLLTEEQKQYNKKQKTPTRKFSDYPKQEHQRKNQVSRGALMIVTQQVIRSY